jgi:hypothetical protein
MATRIIPVTNSPANSQFNIDLDGNTYNLSFHWNITDGAWYLNILGITNTVDQKGLKLVTGPNLLAPYALIDLGALYVVDQTSNQNDPDFDNWGVLYQLYYVEKADLD